MSFCLFQQRWVCAEDGGRTGTSRRRINAVAPGPIATSMFDGRTPKEASMNSRRKRLRGFREAVQCQAGYVARKQNAKTIFNANYFLLPTATQCLIELNETEEFVCLCLRQA